MLKNVTLKKSLGRKAKRISAFPTTFHRKPDRLSLAGCTPAEPASVSPDKNQIERFCFIGQDEKALDQREERKNS
jgi:hypothetical protein